MVFKAPNHWFSMIFDLMVKNKDLNLIGDFLIVGLGGRIQITP